MQTEMTELRQYKAELAEKIRENQEIIDMKSPSLEEVQQYNRLTEERVKRWFPIQVDFCSGKFNYPFCINVTPQK